MAHEHRSLVSTGVEQTQALGEALGELAQAGDIIALNGELGAGKTQLVRGLAAGLGIKPQHVASPTFVLCREYEHEEDAPSDALALVHIDAYRLRSPADLQTIGWDESGAELREQAVVAIEWADHVAAALNASDDQRLTVHLEHVPAGRRITLYPVGQWIERLRGITLPGDE